MYNQDIMEYDSFFALKRAMQTHDCKQRRFWQHDNIAAIKIGWECNCGAQFEIGMQALSSPQEMTNEEYSLLSTPSGRIKLGEILS